MSSDKDEGPRIFFVVGKRDRKRITLTVTITHNTRKQFSETCQVQFGTTQKITAPHTLVIRHFVGFDNTIKIENTQELEKFNTEVFNTKFNQGLARFQINHECTRRKLAAEWQIKDTRRVQMWMSITLYAEEKIQCESEMQEVVFRNGNYKNVEEQDTETIEEKIHETTSIPSPQQKHIIQQPPVQMMPYMPFQQSQEFPPMHMMKPEQSMTIPTEVSQYGNFMLPWSSFPVPTIIPSFQQLRATVVDTLIHLATKWGVLDTHLETAVNFFDRYCVAYDPNGVLMTMGVVSLYHACKLAQEGVYPQTMRDEFVHISGCAVEQFLMFDQQLEQVLGNEIRPTVPRHILKPTLNVIPLGPITITVANMLCDLALMDLSILQHQPNVIALSALFVSMYINRDTLQLAWLSNAEFDFRPSIEHPCVQALFGAFYSMTPPQSITAKYAIQLPQPTGVNKPER